MSTSRWSAFSATIYMFLILAVFVGRPAGAVIVIDNASGSAITPGWFVNPFSPTGETTITAGVGADVEIAVAVGSFGAAQFDGQASAIFGAGALLPANGGAGYKVEFTTEVFGWDSYDAPGTAAPGGTGYWDSFSVNINQSGSYYWELVDGGSGTITDPIIGTDPAGNCVGTAGLIAAAPGCLSGAAVLPGETWVWGPLDSSNTYESNSGSYTLEITGTTDAAYYLSVVLDTATSPDADMIIPSYGAFNPLSTVPLPTTVVPLPAAVWFFGSGLIGLLGIARRKKVVFTPPFYFMGRATFGRSRSFTSTSESGRNTRIYGGCHE